MKIDVFCLKRLNVFKEEISMNFDFFKVDPLTDG